MGGDDGEEVRWVKWSCGRFPRTFSWARRGCSESPPPSPPSCPWRALSLWAPTGHIDTSCYCS